VTRARAGRLARALAVLAWLAAAVSARAQEEKDVLRPCTTADLVGTWQVIRLGVAPSARVDRRDPYFYQHQRYVFSANATMRHLTSTSPITPAAHRALLARATPTTWALDAEGRLVMQRDGEVRVETATCEVLTRNVIDPRTGMPSWPGDVLFTHRDRGDTPVVRRQLRRLTGLGE
jgi:hypothetical protein